MKHRVVNVTEFKATCLALLEEVGRRGCTVTVTKRGRPLATVMRAAAPAWKSPEGAWAGRVNVDDTALSADTASLWDAVREAERGGR